MATILEFKTTSKATAASVMAAYGAGQSAEIVLFPGVRYERHDGEPGAKPSRSRRRRDSLDLEG